MRQASLDASAWLPTYAWWPHPAEFATTVVITTYQAAAEPGAEFHFSLRGYAGSTEPLWEHDVGRLAYGDQRAVRLDALEIPEPPLDGGVLELHAIRLDRQPTTAPFLGMWVDAQGRNGGGYLIPTTPVRGATKAVSRDDIQIIPGVLASRHVETELLLLNPFPVETRATLTVSSVGGLHGESDELVVRPWSAWRAPLSERVPRLRALLAPEGIGSLVVRSSHKLLPFFGFRAGSNPVVSMDHSAPFFA